jgi:hypothetical protein
MNGRYSRLQTFLDLFGQLKAAAGNNPNVLRTFDQTTPEIRAAASRMDDYLAVSDVERELFHGADKLVAHAPKEIEKSWDEFKRLWEPGINYLTMCEYGPDWPRDYNEHLKLYVGSGVIPDDKDDEFRPEFHDGPAAIRQALDYLKDHDECRAGLDALKYLVDTVGLDLAAIMERWKKVPPVFMPMHVAHQQQMNHSGPLTELFEDAVRAYVCGSRAAAFAMCRAILETVLKQSYFLPEELTEKDEFGRDQDIRLTTLLARAGKRHSSIQVARIRPLVQISNKILHGETPPALDDKTRILQFFKILIKTVIEKAPTPRPAR